MKLVVWNPAMSVEATKDLAYWERNMLALRYADGWYNDDVATGFSDADVAKAAERNMVLPESRPRYQGWRRVLTLEAGTITFHIPDDFDVGNLPEVAPNWDGHTTEAKWRRIAEARGVELEQ